MPEGWFKKNGIPSSIFESDKESDDDAKEHSKSYSTSSSYKSDISDIDYDIHQADSDFVDSYVFDPEIEQIDSWNKTITKEPDTDSYTPHKNSQQANSSNSFMYPHSYQSNG
jgi:hypothetical protein